MPPSKPPATSAPRVVPGFEFTHESRLDTDWVPGPGQKHADAPKLRMVVTRVTAGGVYFKSATGTDRSVFLNRPTFEARYLTPARTALDEAADCECVREELVGRVWGALTERERALVREVAVMAFVRGTFHGHERRVPPDVVVVQDALAECAGMPNLYPTVAGLAEPPAPEPARGHGQGVRAVRVPGAR